MIRYSVLVLLSSFCITYTLKAQEKISTKKSLNHEVSIDLVPLVQILSDGHSSTQYYAHYLRKHSNFSFKIAVSGGYQDLTNQQAFYTYQVSFDSSLQVVNKNKSDQDVNIKFGVIKETRGKILTFSYGIDIIAGYESRSETFSAYFYSDDFRFDDLMHPQINEDYPDMTTYSENYFSFGISPHLGLNLNAGDKITFGLQMSPDLYYNLAHNGKSTGDPTNHYNSRFRAHLIVGVLF